MTTRIGSACASSTVRSREQSSTSRISSTQSFGMSSKVAWRVFSALYAGKTATTFLSWSGIGTAAENNTHGINPERSEGSPARSRSGSFAFGSGFTDSGYNPPRVNDGRRTDALAVASLALIVTIAFGDVLFGVDNFYMRDLTRYYYPTKQILREIVQGGEFPYWNRYFSGGQPIAANPEHEVFYPFTWLILLPSYELGYRLLILVHLYIGILGMYVLSRSMELRPFAAWFGGISFGLGGLYLSEVNLLPILFCAAWLPLTCMFVRRFLLGRRLRDFAAASFFLGLQFLVGEPTTVMQTGILIGLYALYRGWYSEWRIGRSV